MEANYDSFSKKKYQNVNYRQSKIIKLKYFIDRAPHDGGPQRHRHTEEHACLEMGQVKPASAPKRTTYGAKKGIVCDVIALCGLPQHRNTYQTAVGVRAKTKQLQNRMGGNPTQFVPVSSRVIHLFNLNSADSSICQELNFEMVMLSFNQSSQYDSNCGVQMEKNPYPWQNTNSWKN